MLSRGVERVLRLGELTALHARTAEAQPRVAPEVRAVRLLGELDRFTRERLRFARATLVG